MNLLSFWAESRNLSMFLKNVARDVSTSLDMTSS
jgi:hypothetical protein